MNPLVPLKMRPEIERLRKAAAALELVLYDLCAFVQPGVTTADLERAATRELVRRGLTPAMPGFEGYPHAICTSVNNVAVHGLPGDYTLRRGDLVTVDVAADRDGWKADAAWTYAAGPLGAERRRLRRAAWRATFAAAAAARAGARMGDIGAACSREAARHGCAVIAEFTGHGIGRRLHEPPTIVHVAEAGSGEPIVPGMVLNVEPVLTLGAPAVLRLDDGWSYVTADGAASAQFELTVVVRGDRTEILTLDRFAGEPALRMPPYG